MKVGDLVTTNRNLHAIRGAPASAVRGGALALIVGFDKDDDPIISYVGGDSDPHPIFRFNVQVLSSGQNLSED